MELLLVQLRGALQIGGLGFRRIFAAFFVCCILSITFRALKKSICHFLTIPTIYLLCIFSGESAGNLRFWGLGWLAVRELKLSYHNKGKFSYHTMHK